MIIIKKIKEKVYNVDDVPDLLEACKVALVVISQHYDDNKTCCNSRINKIKQAINKAEGK